MLISQIYSQYNIPPQLQTHQLRVAAVAKTICDSVTNFSETDSVIKACLLHDMGNIIKFNLSLYPQYLEPQGLDFWQKVKDDFIAKYGPDEHHATHEIAKELGVDSRVFDLISAVGFTKAVENSQHHDLPKKICAYCDQRVSPTGVLSLEARLKEGHERYKNNKNMIQSDEQQFNISSDAMKLLETQIFSHSSIAPDSITDEIINPLMESLRQTHI